MLRLLKFGFRFNLQIAHLSTLLCDLRGMAFTPTKVFWIGKHQTRPELGAPVSKVHKAGLELLKSLGWTNVSIDEAIVPLFAFTTRKGANYAADRDDLPPIRQLPHANSACLDDKRRLQQHLQEYGQQQLMPPSWNSLHEYHTYLQTQLRPEQQQQQPSDKLPASVFVKHRLGVKGQAVYVAHTHQQLQQLQDKLQRSADQFIVQQEVQPLLLHGRKFVMRVHVLVTHMPRQLYLHEDVIVLCHACEYEAGSNIAAVNISSKGSSHPRPLLLRQQLPQLHRQVWPQLQQLVLQSMAAVDAVLWPSLVHPQARLYHLFGYDCMVDAAGHVLLLEVNSYPAIASGTMRHVDAEIFTKLVGDMLTLMVLPAADEAVPDPGGFVPAHAACSGGGLAAGATSVEGLMHITTD